MLYVFVNNRLAKMNVSRNINTSINSAKLILMHADIFYILELKFLGKLCKALLNTIE